VIPRATVFGAYADEIRNCRHATIAVGLIRIRSRPTNPGERSGDLIAVGREALFDPNPALRSLR
jgi:hypothetical protein